MCQPGNRGRKIAWAWKGTAVGWIRHVKIQMEMKICQPANLAISHHRKMTKYKNKNPQWTGKGISI
jgi:hypothetical protein